jgi:pimeloyl-ACP methyl ester carboxylesterase
MKTLGRLVLLGLVLLVVGVLLFWQRPLWVNLQMTHFGMFTSRIQSNYVMTPEGRVHYYEAEPRFAPGHGIPLVLIHGLSDRDESWAPMLKRLKKAGFHVYAPDLLGYGRSPKPSDGDYSIAGEEKFVADFIQAIGLPKADVGGWSMGGWIALKLALDHPEMVDRLVVYDTAGLPMAAPPDNVFHPTKPEDVQELFRMLEPQAKPLPMFVAKDALREFPDKQLAVDANMASMKTGKDAVTDTVGKLTQPLLIVWGKEDALIPLSVGEQLHALVPASELDIAEGCGHLSPLYCSGRVAAATADFLKANPVPQGQVRTLAAMGR